MDDPAQTKPPSLLTNTVNASQTQQSQESYDSRICDMTVEGTTATVEYSTTVEANLVVAIYTEDGSKLLGSGVTPVSPEETVATVEIEISAMPYYFKAGAYLLDAQTNDPVSGEFKTDRYTKTMQDILAATVDDFNPELVLNLDDDRTTNFAVFNENTLLAESGDSQNRSTDNGDGTYTIENADEGFLAMQPGDTFAYTYPDGTVLIVNAASVSVSGTTVTVTDNPDADLSMVFDFVKIEEDSNDKAYTYDDSTLSEGVSIIRNVESAEGSSISAFSNTIGTGVSGSIGNRFEISQDVIGEDGKKVLLSASISHKMTVNLKLYLSYDYVSVSFSVEESRSTTVSLNGSVSIQKYSLGSYDIALCAGVYVHIDPSFIIQASGAMSHTSEQKKITGYSYDSDNGWQDISAPPSQKTKVEFSGKLFYGMEFKAGISIISERIVDLSIKIKAGIELSAQDKVDSLSSPSSSEIHMCNICYEGEISLIHAADIEFQVGGGFIKDKFSLAEGKLKLSDIYYSVDFSTPDSPDMGFSKCPHKLYKFSLTVRSVWHRPIQNVALSLYQDGKELTEVYLLDSTGTLIKSAIPSTDKEGTSIFYLPNGYYTMCLSAVMK